MNRFVIISGCSGGGKSTLIAELKQRGYSIVEEPGRRIVADLLATRQIDDLPWINLAAFAHRAIQLSLQDLQKASETDGWVFFDRGLIDAASALEYATRQPVVRYYAPIRFFPIVFATPPWEELFHPDSERQHLFAEALEEYDRLQEAYRSLGYILIELPRVSVAQRADFLLDQLEKMK